LGWKAEGKRVRATMRTVEHVRKFVRRGAEAETV
jgi:hypothetical protein